MGLSPSPAEGHRERGECGNAETGWEPASQKSGMMKLVQVHTRLRGSLGTTPGNPDSSAQNPERKPGGLASGWSRHGAGFPKPALLWPPGSRPPSREAESQPQCQRAESRREGRREGGDTALMLKRKVVRGAQSQASLCFPRRLQLSLLAQPALQLSIPSLLTPRSCRWRP